MSLVIGALFVAISAVLFAWSYVQYRRPQPPRWTTWDSASNAISLTFVATFAFGLAFLGRFAVVAGQETLGLAEGVEILAIVVVSAALLRALRGQWRRLNAAVQPGPEGSAAVLATVAAPANDSGPGLPPGVGALGGRKRGSRRRAA